MQIPALHSLDPLMPVSETPKPQMGPSKVVRSPLGAIWTALRRPGARSSLTGYSWAAGLEMDAKELLDPSSGA